MGVNVVKKRLSDFRSEESLRYDYKYISSFVTSSKDFYTYRNLFDFVPHEKVDIEQLEKFKYAEIGNIDKLGEVEPVELSFEDRQEENESLFKKIEKGDIINPKKDDILISKIRPYLNKNVLVNSDDEYFTKAFIHIRPKINSELFYLVLRTKFINQINAVSRQGKGYPTLKEDDIKSIRFPKLIVDALIKQEGELIGKISPIKDEINHLKSSKELTVNIINRVIGEAFGFVWEKFEKLSREKVYKISFSKLHSSVDFRSATKFHSIKYDFLKLPVFNNFKFKDFSEFMTLGRQITPSDYEEESEYYYLMPNAIKTFNLEDDVLKPISETFINRFQHISLKYGDLLLAASGEGTIGKAAIYNSEKEAVTSQFIMKIELKDKSLVEYFHYYMQSSYFQLTVEKFKKGMGNMTNIFVSQVKDFPVLYDENKVTEIVEAIKTQLDEQKEIDRQIVEKQQAINKIIEDAIKQEQN
jgi:hypothetical protein